MSAVCSADQIDDANMMKYQVTNRAPEYQVTDTDWGTMYTAYRPAEEDRTYWRFAHFGFPFWTWVPQGDFMDRVSARAWVPMDDEHTMFLSDHLEEDVAPAAAEGRAADSRRSRARLEYLPNTTDWYGRWRPKANAGNDYFIDREAQRNGTIFSGITHIHMQDQAVTESMGPITDHAFENLAPSD